MPSSETPSEPFIARKVPHSWTIRPVESLAATIRLAAAVRKQAIKMRSFTERLLASVWTLAEGGFFPDCEITRKRVGRRRPRRTSDQEEYIYRGVSN